MTSLTESFNPSKHTPLYENAKNGEKYYIGDYFDISYFEKLQLSTSSDNRDFETESMNKAGKYLYRGKVPYHFCNCQSTLSFSVGKKKRKVLIIKTAYHKADWQLQKW